MSCEVDGRDAKYATTLNPFGWCPTPPSNPDCVYFPLPWQGQQAVQKEGVPELTAEAALQAPKATKDYQRMFLLLDKYSCNSGYGIWTPEASGEGYTLTPWKPPDTPTLEQYDANPGKYPAPVPSLPGTDTSAPPPPVAVTPPPDFIPPSSVRPVTGAMITEVAPPTTAPSGGGWTLEKVALLAGLFVAALAIGKAA